MTNKVQKFLIFTFFSLCLIISGSFIIKPKSDYKDDQINKKYICNQNFKKPSLVTKNKPLQKVTKSLKPNFDFLPYENCNAKNDYLNKQIDNSYFTKLSMNSSKLSPLCTYASLDHPLRGAYQKSCHRRPRFTRHKPCLTKNYHRFIHNQITMAANCFHIDPKTLFALYTTESFLQINVKPSSRESAEGISQLMPQYAVKHINSKVSSSFFKNDNLYKQNLRHFQSKSTSNICYNYLKNLENIVTKPEKKNRCHRVPIDQKVSQDIYYSVAYGLESIRSNMRSLLKQKSLFIGDYSRFFKKLTEYPQSRVISCKSHKGSAREHCLSSSTLQVELFISEAKRIINWSQKYFTKTINPIGESNLKRKIISNFPQINGKSSIDQIESSLLYPLLNNSFVKNYCQIESIPQLENYNLKTVINRKKSVKTFQSELRLLISEIRDCRKQIRNAYIDIYHAMNDNNKKILNEVSFYHHNGGTKINYLFSRYIKQKKNSSKLRYKKFTGTKRGSFRNFIIKTEGPSQATNFLYNTPQKNRYGRVIAGSHSSTRSNINLIKNKIKKLSSSLVSPKNKLIIQKVTNSTGFKKLCSHY